jgi:hypothetical protein
MPDSEQLETLKQENQALHKRLDELTKSSIELASYKIFVESREKFLKWIAIITVILGGFGFVSLSNIIETIKNQAATEVTKNIVPQVTKDLQEGEHGKEIRKKIVEKISTEVSTTVLKEARDQVNQQVSVFKSDLEEIRKQNQKLQDATSRLQTDVDIAISQPKQSQLQQKVEEQKYLVIAGSSADKKYLEDYSLSYKQRLGDKYKIRVCRPQKGNKLSAIVLGDPLSLKDAQVLVEMAKKDGFRSDTYPIRENSAFFEFGAMCELI